MSVELFLDAKASSHWMLKGNDVIYTNVWKNHILTQSISKKRNKNRFPENHNMHFWVRIPYVYIFYIYMVCCLHLYYFIKSLQHHHSFPKSPIGHAAQLVSRVPTSMPFRGHQFPRRSDAALVSDGKFTIFPRRWYAYLEPVCPLFLVVEPYKTRFFPIKTRVIWVTGIYLYGIYYSIRCILYTYIYIYLLHMGILMYLIVGWATQSEILSYSASDDW